jgi:hypothetical protein
MDNASISFCCVFTQNPFTFPIVFQTQTAWADFVQRQATYIHCKPSVHEMLWKGADRFAKEAWVSTSDGMIVEQRGLKSGVVTPCFQYFKL